MIDESFSNQQVDLENIAQSSKLLFELLEKDYLKVSLIISAIFCFALLIGGGITFMKLQGSLNAWQTYLLPTILLLLICFILFMTYMGFHYKSYALRENDIVYQRGYIYRSKTIIPFNRVQHCEVNQGPIDRMFGLSELKIFTAGGSSSDMRIPGLTTETANNLKQFIARKTGDGRSEEE